MWNQIRRSLVTTLGADLQELDAQGVHLSRSQGRLLQMFSQGEHQDVGGGVEQEADYRSAIVWDTTKPNGQPRRRLDTSRAADRFGWSARTSFAEGLRESVAWFRENRTRRVTV